jgi:hypothetical protein
MKEIKIYIENEHMADNVGYSDSYTNREAEEVCGIVP